MQLTALRPENPVAVMAAYGLLRLLPTAQLRWAGLHPELRYDGDVIADLAAMLPARLQAPELTLMDDPREKHVLAAGGYAAIAQQMPHQWLSAYCCETADGLVGTGLIAYGGNYTLIRAVRDVVKALADADRMDRLDEALLGPWQYRDHAGVALGWDPGARQDSAALPSKPQRRDKPTVLAANWLAWEALPAWQMVNGRTPGIEPARKGKHNKRWTYPTCAEWLSWQGARALIIGRERMHQRELAAMGVRLWRTEIIDRTEGGEYGLARTVSARNTPDGSKRTRPPRP